MNKVIVFFILLTTTGYLHSQSIIDGPSFIRKCTTESQTINSSKDANIRLPWIEDIQLRTETRDFDIARQEYTLRFTPTSRGLRQAQKEYYKNLVQSPDFDQAKLNKALLEQAYYDWVALYILEEKIQIQQKNQTILKDKKSLLDHYSSTYAIDPQKIIKSITSQNDLEINLRKLKSTYADLKSNHGILENQLDFSTLVDASQITNKLGLTEINKLNIDVQKNEYELALIQKEINLEKSENRQLLDFAQLKYQGPYTDPYQEKISIGLGLQFPNSGNQKLKIKELELKASEITADMQYEKNSQKSEVMTIKSQLYRALDQYDYSEKLYQEERKELKIIADQISKKEGFNPMTLLEIEERHLTNLYYHIAKKEEIYRLYLEYLSVSGLLTGPTFCSFLMP